MSATLGRWTDASGTIGSSSKTPGDSFTAGDAKGVFVIHAVLLHTGKVLWWSGHAETVDYLAESWVWDPTQPPSTATKQSFPHDPMMGHEADAFCCHHVTLEDGRVLTAGGAAMKPDHGRGIKAICIFDPATTTWQKIGDLNEARWYPTLVTLPDGRVVAFSGRTAPGVVPIIAESVELLSPPFKSPLTRKKVADKFLAIYPGLHLVKGGKIFYTGTTWRYEPPANTPINTFSFRMTGLSAGAWTDEGIHPSINEREEGTSILLPPAQDGKILLLGGGRAIGTADTFTGLTASSRPKSAEILNTQSASPTWTPAGAAGEMNLPHINASAVLLPDGTVLIVGGHDSHKWAPSTANPPAFNPTPLFHSPNHYAKRAEIYDPIANTFTLVAEMHDPRTYHSACLLLQDGRVLCAGGVNSDSSELNAVGLPVTLNQKTMEFYEPTYFFKGPRPVITSVLRGKKATTRITYDGEFMIETPQAANIDKVVLTRPGAMTHHTDTEQRFVNLDFKKEAGKLRVKVLNDPTVAPPGFYMLWIVDDKRLPCQRARFVGLSHRKVKPKITKCRIRRREVETLLAVGSVARFANALEVELEGFFSDELGITTATPTPEQLITIAPAITFTRADGTAVPGIAATVQALHILDASLPADLRQPVTFSYALEFTGTTAFLDANHKTISEQPITVTASKGDFFGDGEMTLFEDSFGRVLVTLRRAAGDRFFSIKEIEVIDACDQREETDSTVFVPGVPDSALHAQLATMSDEVKVVAPT